MVCVQFTENAGQGLAAAVQQRTLWRRAVHSEPGASLPSYVGPAWEGWNTGPPYRPRRAIQL